MASRKYAYYNKGNKIAIVEQSETTSSGKMAVAHCTLSGYSTKDTCEAAGGQWIPGSSGNIDSYGEYTSPATTVADGLEIEYSYAPIYNYGNTADSNNMTYPIFGAWGSDGTNLILFAYAGGVIVQGKSVSGLLSVDDWIYISGSSRWSGLHKIKALTDASNGIITLDTPFKGMPKTTCAVDYTAVSGSVKANIVGDGDNDKREIEMLKDMTAHIGDKTIYIDDAVSGLGAGIFEVSYPSDEGKIELINKYTMGNSAIDFTKTSAAGAANSADSISIFSVVPEHMTVTKNIEVMQDESFELDLTRAQARAIVYYLKGMQAEDSMEIEMREYYMALFRNEIGKAAASRKYGPYIASGHWSMK